MKRLTRFLVLPVLLSACVFSVTSCDNSNIVDFIDVRRVSFSTGRAALSYRMTTFTDHVQVTEQEYAELNAYDYGRHYYLSNWDYYRDDYRDDKTIKHNLPKGATIKYCKYNEDAYEGQRTTYYRAKIKSANDYFVQLKFDGSTATIRYHDVTNNYTKTELSITATDWTVTKQNGKIVQVKNNEWTIYYFVE
ncbi:MAG: hypothetical protein LBR37_00430 [Erysipelotrichaceae bacterium]|jgi:hypothetical protein|nr:hypothetical protein [Erysipelotrichaceae bacterium]